MIELVDTIEILQPNQIAFSFTHQDVSCHGLSDGSVDLTVSGGTSPYSYQWFNSDYVLAAITEDVLYMKADTYMVVVTDTFGCSNSTMLIISQPDPLNFNISTDDVECFGGSTGNIDIDVFGGTPPYTYQWSNGATSQDLQNIIAGSYTVTVTDSNGCFKIETITIYESDPIELAFDIIDVSCIDNKDGEVIVFASGGTGSYSYLWSTGDITDHIYDDTWIIENIHLYPNCSVKIHNRWGKFVYESKGYEDAWDGSYNGNAVPAETYYYIIKLRDDIEVKTGTVTIVR
jgi:gliding motility-associated-like protein